MVQCDRYEMNYNLMNRVKIGAKDNEFELRFDEYHARNVSDTGMHAKRLLKTIMNSNLVKILDINIQFVVKDVKNKFRSTFF